MHNRMWLASRLTMSFVLSGLFFGLAIGLWARASGQFTVGAETILPTNEQASVTLSHDRFKISEPVTFTLTNRSRHRITCPAPEPFLIYTLSGSADTAPAAIYIPATPHRLIILAPGESASWSWDQRTTNGQLAGAGEYYVEIACSEGDWAAKFRIGDSDSTIGSVLPDDNLSVTNNNNKLPTQTNLDIIARGGSLTTNLIVAAILSLIGSYYLLRQPVYHRIHSKSN